MAEPTDNTYRDVVKAIADGRLIPFLGAGANRCGRGEFKAGQNLPDGGELAEHLAAEFDYPGADKRDLTRVAPVR